MFFRPHTKTTRGFGLVELMVSISIMALVSTVILVRQSAFNGAVLLRNQTYEVAFAVRQAQQLAVSGGDESSRRYGVHFSNGGGLEKTYFLFRDANNNEEFDQNEQIGLTGRLDSRFKVRGFDLSGDTDEATLTLVFERPNFDALVCSGGACDPVEDPVFIDVAKVDTDDNDTSVGTVRRVQITPAGEISVVTYSQD